MYTKPNQVPLLVVYHRCLFYIFNQATMAEDQEFINILTLDVRDFQGKRVNPPYRSSKVIPLKLVLGIVPSPSEDVTRATREQPDRLSRKYLFWFRFIPEMFSALSVA